MVGRARDKTLIMMTFQSHSHIMSVRGRGREKRMKGETVPTYMYSVYRHKVNDVWHYTGGLN